MLSLRRAALIVCTIKLTTGIVPGSCGETRRESLLRGGSGAAVSIMSLVGRPSRTNAGRVEELIDSLRESDLGVSSAVQSSDLGVAVRQRVVRGAQIADALDARWDALSFSLRGQQKKKKQSKSSQTSSSFLNPQFASYIRQSANAVAAANSGATLSEIEQSIQEAKLYYAPVFQVANVSEITNRTVFDLDTYAAFRVYNALSIEPDAFEMEFGKHLLDFFFSNEKTATPISFADTSDGAERILRTLVDLGYASALDFRRPLPDNDNDDDDNDNDMNQDNYQLSVTLSDPTELKARLKLEAQARRLKLRLLPDLATTVLRAYFIDQCRILPSSVKLEEYFVDNEYRTAFDSDQYTDLQLEILFFNTT